MLDGSQWKNFIFKIIQLEDVPSVLSHLEKTFYRDEPLMSSLEQTPAMLKDLNNWFGNALSQPDGLCFAVIEAETGKIAGVRVNVRATKDEPEPPFKFESDVLKSITHCFESLNKKCNIYEKYNVEEYADFLAASVDPEFRGLGIATEMYKRSIELLREKGFKIGKCIFSSPFTYRASLKLGFEEIARIKFNEILNVDTGSTLHTNPDPERFVAVSILKL